MANHIIQIGKHRFVCGLFWQSLSRPRELEKEAAELAKKIDSDLLVLRRDNTTAQAGFAQTSDGARRMMYSLGAAVSKAMALEGANYDGQKQPAHNWLGAFKLPDGMWAYFAVRDANFLPNGDFAGTKEEVLERLHGDYGLGGWNVVIGDPELEALSFHNFNARTIDSLLPHKKDGRIDVHKWWALKPAERKFSVSPIAIVVAMTVLVAAGGFLGWQKYQKQKQEQQQQLALAAARAQMDGKAPSTLPHPWRDKPLPLAVAQACAKQLKYLTAGGWQLTDYLCTASSATYSWSRQSSTIEFLRAQVPKAVFSMDGSSASYSEPVKLTAGRDEKLLDTKALIEPLLSRMQLLDIVPKIVDITPPPPPPPPPSKSVLPGGEPEVAPVPDWKTFSLSLQLPGLPPTEIAAILSQPGIRLDKFSYKAGAWSIEGVMYVK
ncbi:MAG: type 4b pilus protein PilO2 [Herminiimonas sp.]|nr:type 4b pilus protein PilO2 [Herminiimonas sp.]